MPPQVPHLGTSPATGEELGGGDLVVDFGDGGGLGGGEDLGAGFGGGAGLGGGDSVAGVELQSHTDAGGGEGDGGGEFKGGGDGAGGESMKGEGGGDGGEGGAGPASAATRGASRGRSPVSVRVAMAIQEPE